MHKLATILITTILSCWVFLVFQVEKNLPTMQETKVQSLGGEVPLEKEWLYTPVSLPGELCGQRSLVGYNLWGHTVECNWMTECNSKLLVRSKREKLHKKFSITPCICSRSGGYAGAGGPRGATPRSRSGGAVVRRYPWPKVRSSGCALLEQPCRDTPSPR